MVVPCGGTILSLRLTTAISTPLSITPYTRIHHQFSTSMPFSFPNTASLSVSITKHLPILTNISAAAGFTSATGPMIYDAAATAVVAASAYGLVSTFNTLTKRNVIDQNLSRKLVHILSGILFMASWPIYSTWKGARYFASIVPIINCIRLVIYGLSLAKDEGLVKSVTREGNPRELLRGPLYYVLVLIVCAIFFWRDSPVGVIAVAMMCGGDGIADIIGRRFGSLKLPYNQQKSWAGSISMFILGFLVSIGMLYYFSAFGYFELDWSLTLQKVALVSLVATVVESIPTKGFIDDNFSVPLVSMATAMLCLN